MKKNNSIRRMYWMLNLPVIFLLFSCQILLKDFEYNDVTINSDTIALNELQREFIRTETNKDGAAHQKLFFTPSSQFNFVLSNYQQPVTGHFKRDEWINYFSSWTYGYYPVYSSSRYFIHDGIAINCHSFQGYKNDNRDISGTDIFTFIKLKGQWKIINITSSIYPPDDSGNYSSYNNSISPKPSEVIDQFIKGANNKDTLLLRACIANINIPVYGSSNSSNIDEDRFPELDGFLQKNTSGILLNKLTVSFSEPFLNILQGSYTMKKDGRTTEYGRVMAVLAGTVEKGWKITGIYFIKEQI